MYIYEKWVISLLLALYLFSVEKTLEWGDKWNLNIWVDESKYKIMYHINFQ